MRSPLAFPRERFDLAAVVSRACRCFPGRTDQPDLPFRRRGAFCQLERRDVMFRSGDDLCAAWLYPSTTTRDLVPIVVMAHGLSGTRRDRLGAFAERFAAAGLAALVFDHRGFGDSTGEPDLFHPARQLEDWRAAIAFARSLPGVDPSRVATFGSAMGR